MRVALPDGETVIDHPTISHHLGEEDNSGRGRFPAAGRLNTLPRHSQPLGDRGDGFAFV
jgi:hypothetical protein